MGARFLLLAVVCLSLMLLDYREQHTVRIRQALSVVVYPVRLLVDLPFDAWASMRTTFAARDALVAENESLRGELLMAQFRLQRLAAVEAENSHFRELLESTARIENRALVAEILAVDLDPYKQRFVLDRGAVDGVYQGQALLDGDGVVGQVVKVEAFTAEALLITDADHALPVSVLRNGVRTIAVGTGESGRLRLPYLLNHAVTKNAVTDEADIQVGDELRSSGLGGVFPADYPVGIVTEIKVQPDQAFAEVIAVPVAALDRDRDVLLVWESPDVRRAPAATPSVADAD